MNTVLYWLRNDLRLSDNLALLNACAHADALLPIYIHEPRSDEKTHWGFTRMSQHRRAVLASALASLDTALHQRGSRLLILHGEARVLIPKLVRDLSLSVVHVERIAAPEEQADIAALRAAGVSVHEHWQSSLLEPDALPFALRELPDVFTTFRTRVEKLRIRPAPPQAAPDVLPPWPDSALGVLQADSTPITPAPSDARSAFNYTISCCEISEANAQRHLAHYLQRRLPHTYKATRNGLIGQDYSSKWSPFLALGTISARQIYSALQAFEREHGANDGSYWLWFELLWRDYFRFLHCKYGLRLYRAEGLSTQPKPSHNSEAFARWCRGETGHAFIDAAMRELAATGYLSNRMRQVAASYLIHDLACDWRAGAAWFEAQLIDFDVYSNQGNWLYLAGRGTDPRGGRRFNPDKQAHDYDPNGVYRALWLRENSPTTAHVDQ